MFKSIVLYIKSIFQVPQEENITGVYIMGYSTRQSLARATLVNQDQGGGNKKMGLVPRENIPAAAAVQYRNHLQTLIFTQTLQSP